MTIIEEYLNSKNPDLKEKAAIELSGDDLIKKNNPGLFMTLLDVLDRPGNATRALMVGKLGGLKGLIPFAQTIEDLTGLDIGLNKEDRVAGREVIETLFGKMPNKEGKLDLGDALGLVVEIAADPLWLVGGAGGLTKLGKARALVGSNVRGLQNAYKAAQAAGNAAEAAKYSSRIHEVLTAVHKGTPFTGSKKLQQAVGLINKTDPKKIWKLRSPSWTKQAQAGERAALTFLGKPVVKGEKAIAGAEKAADYLRTQSVLNKLIPESARTKIANSGVHDIFRRSKDEQLYKHSHRMGKAAPSSKLIQELVKDTGLSYDEVNNLVFRMAELGDTPMRYAAMDMNSPQVQAQLERFVNELFAIGKKAGNKNMPKLQQAAGVQGIMDDLLKEARKAGIPLEEVGGDLKYMHRIMSPEYEKASRPFNPRFDGGEIKSRPQRGRQASADKLIPETELDAAGYGAKKMFNTDVMESVEKRSMSHAHQMAQAEAIKETVNKFGRSTDKGIRKGWISVRKVADKLRDANLPVLEGLPLDKQIPVDVAEAAFKRAGQLTKTQQEKVFGETLVGAQRFMKGAFTSFFPAYHARNAVSNKILNWLEGVWRPASYIDSAKMQRAAQKTRKIMRQTGEDFMTAAKKVDWPTVNAGGMEMAGYEVYDLASRNGVLGRAVGYFDPEEVGGGILFNAPKQGVKKAYGKAEGAGRRVGQAVEDHDRLAHFLEKLKDGLSPQDAAKSMKTAMVDYSDLSQFEKTWMRDRLFFFYSFARKNLPQQARKLLDQPAKQAVFSHLVGGTPRIQGDGKNYPDWMQEMLNVPLPLRGKDGKQVVVRGLGTPIEEAFGSFAGAGTGVFDRASRVARRQFLRLNPAIVAGTELATGRNMFFDQPINNPTDWLLSKSPAGRFAGTYRGLSSDKTTTGQKLSQNLTGIRYDMEDPAANKARKLKEVARDYLERNKKARQYKRYYVPKDQPVDPMTQAVMEYQ